MERTEPCLMPEWLKGAGTASAHHQEDGGQHYRQRSQNSFEQDSPRYSTYIPPRRDRIYENSGRTNENSRIPYENSGSRVYPNFGRGSSYHNNLSYRNKEDNYYDRDKELHWDFDKDRDNGRWSNDFRRSHSLGRDTGEKKLVNGNYVSPGLPVQKPFERNSHSLENGEKKLVNGSHIPPALSVQKAASFERNFPSLGIENGDKKPVHSSLGNVSVLTGSSPRHLWQQQPGYIPLEVRGHIPAEPNGVISSPSAPKMAEALVQNPPRVKTPPQLSTESQRLEELALKQSRQLVPITPPTSREKSKPKLTGGVASSSTSKLVSAGQQPLSRGQPSPRPETPKTLVVLNRPGVAISDGTAPSSASMVSAVRTSVPSRKPKQLLDRRAVPIPLSASPSAGRVKENGTPTSEEKRIQASQAQNRSDFFNAIRKKSASAKVAEVKQEESSNLNNEISGEPKNDSGNDSPNMPAEQENKPVVSEDGDDKTPVEDSCSIPVEEVVFLRSLGWEESANGDDELTEEEIQAFYQTHQHMRSSTSSPLSSRFQNTVGANSVVSS